MGDAYWGNLWCFVCVTSPTLLPPWGISPVITKHPIFFLYIASNNAMAGRPQRVRLTGWTHWILATILLLWSYQISGQGKWKSFNIQLFVQKVHFFFFLPFLVSNFVICLILCRICWRNKGLCWSSELVWYVWQGLIWNISVEKSSDVWKMLSQCLMRLYRCLDLFSCALWLECVSNCLGLEKLLEIVAEEIIETLCVT